MDENNVVDMELSTEIWESDTESIISDSEYSENDVVDGSDSINSNGYISSLDETDSVVESEVANALQQSEETNDVAMQSTETIVYQSVETETYFNEELGGYPVVIMYDMSEEYNTSLMADYEDYYITLSTTWEDYFSGVLANIGDTEYIAYCLRDYASSSYSNYTDHYVLYYDLQIENDSLVSGTYPYMDIYRDSSYSGYICNEGNGMLSSVPFPSYGSFGKLSDIREGVTHNETYAILFAVGFAVVYCVCTRIFDYVRSMRDKRRS